MRATIKSPHVLRAIAAAVLGLTLTLSVAGAVSADASTCTSGQNTSYVLLGAALGALAMLLLLPLLWWRRHRGAYLGAEAKDASAKGGALVISVVAGGPADRAGIEIGDTVTLVETKRISDAKSLEKAIAARHPGDEVRLTLTKSNGKSSVGSVILAARPPRSKEIAN